VIRPAVPADAEAIDRVHVHAWERAYGDFIAPDRMRGATPVEERVARWRERLQHPVIRTWVFEVDGFLAGFASAGGGELMALYVDPAAQGAGAGTALLAQAEEAMRAEGSAEAELWVFSANEHGRRFYEARGWELDEDSEQQLDWAAPGVRYRKRL
jgi:GNAT superfamily N-acetyltransferase